MNAAFCRFKVTTTTVMAALHLFVRASALCLAVTALCVWYTVRYLSSGHYIAFPMLSNTEQNLIMCNDISWPWNCLSNGSWILRDGVTEDDIRRRREMDESIQGYLGWPRSLFRTDRRCGNSFKIPSTTFPSLCDENSDVPCCNEAIGRCGKGAAYCNCKNCQDFRRYVSAELSRWVPHDTSCLGEEFSKDSACDFLQKHVSNIVFVGDSLIRHFFAALAVLVTNDYTRGALNVKLKPEELKQCEGEYQFVDRGKYNCHETIAHAWEELARNKVCDGTETFKLSLVEAYSSPFVGQAVDVVRKLLGKKGSIMIMGVGLHMALNHREVIDKYLNPVLSVKKNDTSRWPVILWTSVPAPQNYLKSSVSKLEGPIIRFNSQMKLFCNQHGIYFFDTTEITKGIKSSDGRHFGFGGNMAKVQLLIKFLKQRIERCGSLIPSKKDT